MMGDEMRLEGTMIPRRVKRIFDQRAEARLTLDRFVRFSSLAPGPGVKKSHFHAVTSRRPSGSNVVRK